MGYREIIKARGKVKHLFGGLLGTAAGNVGSAVSGNVNSTPVGKAVNDYFYGIPGAIGSIAQGKSPIANTPLSPGGGGGSIGAAAGSLVPTDNFQAQTPGITTDQFGNQQIQNQGVGLVTQGSTDLAGVASDQQGLSNYLTNQATSGGPQGTNLAGIQGQQQTLANALQQQANGGGPNPAQLQYQNNVNNAIAQQQSAVASAKGINPALAARMGADIASQNIQGGAATEAAQQAQQQLNAESQLAGVQNNMVGTAGASAQQQLAAQQAAAAQQGAVANTYGAEGNLGLGIYNTASGNVNAQNNAITAGSLGAQGINAGVAEVNQASQANAAGGVANGAGGLLGGLIPNLAHGGVVHDAVGGDIMGGVPDMSAGIMNGILASDERNANAAAFGGGGSSSNGKNSGIGMLGQAGGMALGQYLLGGTDLGTLGTDISAGGWAGSDIGAGLGGAAAGAEGGGAVDTAIAAGEEAAPYVVAAASKGGKIDTPKQSKSAGDKVDRKALSLAQALMSDGGQVPGKAEYAGDDPRNDVVPTALSKGEEVLPLSITQAPDAPQKAAEFVAKLQMKSHPTFGAVLKAKRNLETAVKAHKAAGGYC